MTLTAGVHDGIPAAEYHADALTPEVALSASGIKTLLTGSPADFAANNRRLSAWPDLIDDPTEAQDSGTIVHALVLGTVQRVIACEPEDCPARTDKKEPYKSWSGRAKAWKEAQRAEGAIVVPKDRGANILAAAESLTLRLQKEYADHPLGPTEVTLIWQEETPYGPIWCRARIDEWAPQFMVALDPKSTDWPLTDFFKQKKANDELWDVQAAWYLRGLYATHPMLIGQNIDFRFPLVRVVRPYDATICDLEPDCLALAEEDILWARDLFAKCLYSNEWPKSAETTIIRPSSRRIAMTEARRNG